MVGLSGAGKTTTMYRVNRIAPHMRPPGTIGINVEHGELWPHIAIDAWDLDISPRVRPLYARYYKNTDAVIFIIDANDKERLDEVKEHILRLVDIDMKDMDYPILFFANKQDLKNALTCEELIEKLDLKNLIKNRIWHMQGTQATIGGGLYT
eukprot:UN03566